MKRDDQDNNLSQLIQEYRDKGRALKGYKALKPLLHSNKLFVLLRNHEDDPITSEYEISFRDNIDFLLKFYSILQVAIVAGFIKPELNKRIRDEISIVLSNKAVKRYYISNYPLSLPLILNSNINFVLVKQNKGALNSNLFISFLMTIRSIEDDSDIELFLWLLDNGEIDGYSLSDLLDVLKNKAKTLKYIRLNDREDALGMAFWGYFKYINFILEYKQLLNSAHYFPLLQSAIWHYQSYWFLKMETKLRSILIPSLKRFHKVIIEINSDIQKGEINIPKENSLLDSGTFIEIDSKDLLRSVCSDIRTVLNRRNYNILSKIIDLIDHSYSPKSHKSIRSIQREGALAKGIFDLKNISLPKDESTLKSDILKETD